MKKIFALILAVVMCLLLASCGNKLEGRFWEYKMMYGSDWYNYSLSFEDGEVTLSTPDGTQTYDYEITGKNTIVIDGILTYTYEIDGDKLEFDKPFIGTKDTWYN